jgi:integrase
MAPKPRNKENKGLPKRWRYKNGAYRYQVPRGQEAAWGGKREFTLGKTLRRHVGHDQNASMPLRISIPSWGIIKQNQLLGQAKLDQPQARDRLDTDQEIDTALNIPSKSRGVVIAKLHSRLKLMTGLRRKDIPQLKVSDIRADGIHVQPSKTKKTSGKRLIIEWDKGGELRAVIDKILRVPPKRIGDAPVFITMDGNSYINANGQARAVPCLL